MVANAPSNLSGVSASTTLTSTPRDCGGLRLFEDQGVARRRRVRQNGHAGEAGNDLGQELQPSAGQRPQKTHAGDIPARPVEARNETARNGIIAQRHDWHGPRRIFHCLGCRCAVGQNDVHVRLNQLAGEFRQNIVLAVGKSIIKTRSSALPPSRIPAILE